ncbi:unnamed protein product [Schistosoma turkestanicum]|nr:unnamed protein product [Schistosoma turkestanicum]
MNWSSRIIVFSFILLFSLLLFIECRPSSKGNQIIPGYSEYEYLNIPNKRMLNGLRFQELLRLQKLKDSAKWLEDLGKRSSSHGINSLVDEEYD